MMQLTCDIYMYIYIHVHVQCTSNFLVVDIPLHNVSGIEDSLAEEFQQCHAHNAFVGVRHAGSREYGVRLKNTFH